MYAKEDITNNKNIYVCFSSFQFEKYYTGDVEDIRKRNCELERMLDEMRRKMDELTKEVTNTKVVATNSSLFNLLL